MTIEKSVWLFLIQGRFPFLSQEYFLRAHGNDNYLVYNSCELMVRQVHQDTISCFVLFYSFSFKRGNKKRFFDFTQNDKALLILPYQGEIKTLLLTKKNLNSSPWQGEVGRGLKKTFFCESHFLEVFYPLILSNSRYSSILICRTNSSTWDTRIIAHS